MNKLLFPIIALLVIMSSCASDAPKESKKINVPKSKPTPEYSFSVENQYPHSQLSFTEGLLWYNNQLFESTGSPDNLPQAKSIFGPLDLTTGEIRVMNELDPQYFGEGITILNDKIYQLTYTSKTGFVYDLNSGKQLKTFTIPTKEGWGMTNDGESLIMSDGTEYLHFLDPNTLEKTGTLRVIDKGRAIRFLNELEYVDGYIYANIYTTDWIVKINVNNGGVEGKLDLTDLKLDQDKRTSNALETNGIAYNPENKKFYVTGKMWDAIYEISIYED